MKKIPHFKTIDEESEFWEKNDTTDYIDWSKAKVETFPNLKPSSVTIDPSHFEFILRCRFCSRSSCIKKYTPDACCKRALSKFKLLGSIGAKP